MAALYLAQARYREAAPLYREALQGTRELLGHDHPSTVLVLYGLAQLYLYQGHYGKAAPLYIEALRTSRKLGARHPTTLTVQLGAVNLLVNQKQRPKAVRTLQQMEANLLGWIGQEFYSSAADAVRGQLATSQVGFQDAVFTLATMKKSNADARKLAGRVMLRFK